MDKTEFFKDVNRSIFDRYNSNFKDKEQDELPPSAKALMKLVSTFPVPIVVAVVEDKDTEPPKLFSLVVYDFHANNKNTVDGGTIGFSDEDIENLLNRYMSMRIKIKDMEKSAIRYLRPDEGYYIGFFNYDIYQIKKRFSSDLTMDISLDLSKMYYDEFDDSIDFNKIYSLEPDKIIPEEEILEVDSTSAATPVVIDDKIVDTSIENFQRAVSHVQLIPKVPDEVKEVFNVAKKLFIFRSIEYHFGMVSVHYASLSIECALKNYYNQWLGDKAILENQRGGETTVNAPDIRRIEDFLWRTKGWDRHRLNVNGEPYPHSMFKLARWVVEKEGLPKYHIEELKRFIGSRNWLSHPTHLPIFPGQPGYLEDTAYYINLMFHE